MFEEIDMKHTNDMEFINNSIKEQKEIITNYFENKMEDLENKYDEGR